MSWFKVDDTLAFHAKVVAAGNAAMGLWVRAGSWSMQQLTDGRIPAHMAQTLGSRAEIRRLLDVGLWETADDGYTFHGWNDPGRQRTKDEVVADREAAAQRQRNARDRARQARAAREAERDSAGSNLDSHAPVTRDTDVTHAEVQGPSRSPRPDQTRPVTTKNPPGGRKAPATTAKLDIDVPSPAPSEPDVNVSHVVAAWVTACEGNDVKPTGGMRAQVGRNARELLAAGNDPADVLAAATAAGAAGFTTIDRELARMKGRPRLTPVPAPAAPDTQAWRRNLA